MNQRTQRQRVIVFDVNETLLDIDALTPFFERHFGDAAVMRQWFAELILYSQTLTLSGHDAPFGQLAVAVLAMVAEVRGVALDASGIDEFKGVMAGLPAHADAAPALTMLSNAGFRLVTLTNSASAASKAAIDAAGLAGFFEQQFSVDAVRQFKPAVATYRSVEAALGADPASLRLVAAHTWDTFGAIAAGWKAALVARPGNAALPLGEQPDIVAPDLLVVASRIIDTDVD